MSSEAFPALAAGLRPGPARDALPPALRWGLRAGVVLAHVGVVWALLQVQTVRETVGEVAPIMVDWIAPPQPEAAPQPAPAPVVRPQARTVVQPQPRPQVIAAPPAPAAERPAFVAPAPEPAPPADPVPAQAAAAATPGPPAPPAAPAGPRNIPSSAVRYLVRPPVVYPPRSQDLGESGSVMLRVLIDERGQPREVTVQKSSGFARLDQAAVEAMRRARFQPYSENGVALPVWAPAEIKFEPPQE
ncbi:MAG: energy transducer TonB [Burkholderiales bacterium]|nr:energy transducer TonB [Burkholderiales bacterium]